MPHMAFILLKKAKFQKPDKILAALRKHAPGWGFWAERPDNPEQGKSIQSFGFDGGRVFVAFMPLPIPEGEAESAIEFSLGCGRKSAQKLRHKAHLLVTMQLESEMAPIDAQRLFTRSLAAVLDATEAVGVYWGEGVVTHPTDFFLDVVGDDESMWITLWTGIHKGRDGPNRLSLQSLGMGQFELMDLMVTAPVGKGELALTRLIQMLSYSLERGSVIPDGDTVGGSMDERIPVRHEQSPVDPEAKIWRFDLP